MKKPAQYDLSTGAHAYSYHLPNFVIVVIFNFSCRQKFYINSAIRNLPELLETVPFLAILAPQARC